MIDLTSIDLDRIECEGITQPVSEWALDYGIPASLIADRLARGWPVDLAITTPMATKPGAKLSGAGDRAELFEFDGESLSISEWADRFGLNPATVRARLKRGLSIRDALQPVEAGRSRANAAGLTRGAGSDFQTDAGDRWGETRAIPGAIGDFTP